MRFSGARGVGIGLWIGIAAAGCLDEEPAQVAFDEARVVGVEDGLAQAYAIFAQQFVQEGQDRRNRVAVGFHPGLGAERVEAGGEVVNGAVILDRTAGRIEASLRGVPAADGFDLWLVKNGPDGTAAPDAGDDVRFVGSFGAAVSGARLLAVDSALATFDLDLAVVTRAGADPVAGAVAAGARTLFEKRFFREAAGLPAPPVTGALSDAVETTDPLVRRGAALFFDETFGGNGRTCGTCHRAENNLTIDAAFIATLPPSDPLFVAEIVPELAALEDANLLRNFGLIRENLDGFEAPETKFVQRTVQHTLAMSATLGLGTLPTVPNDGPPPDQRTGWSGDGAPGRGTLNEFAFGAVVQHFPLTLARVPGVDFRVPTQAELDALEAFQLFSGRQKNPRTDSLTFADAAAESGKQLFLGTGQCVTCHRDLVGSSNNFMADTGIENISRVLSLPVDAGFGVALRADGGFGTGRFNVPPLVEAADTGPFFHNGSVAIIEDAVSFYLSAHFNASPGRNLTGTIVLDQTQVDAIGAFLRVINALENVRQVRKRVQFAHDVRSPGNTEILAVAIEDLDDALRVMDAPSLSNPSARHALLTSRQILVIAAASADDQRTPFLSIGLTWLGLARSSLLIANPLNEF
jgi:cytochrome c peroxidase